MINKWNRNQSLEKTLDPTSSWTYQIPKQRVMQSFHQSDSQLDGVTCPSQAYTEIDQQKKYRPYASYRWLQFFFESSESYHIRIRRRRSGSGACLSSRIPACSPCILTQKKEKGTVGVPRDGQKRKTYDLVGVARIPCCLLCKSRIVWD